MPLSVNFNLQDIVFAISFHILIILVTSFSIGTEKLCIFQYSLLKIKLPFKICQFIYDKIIVRSIVKIHRDFFWYTIFYIINFMCSTSLLTCIKTMIFKFTIFFIFRIFLSSIIFYLYRQTFLYKYSRCLHSDMILALHLLMISFFLFKINYLHCLVF